MFYHLPVHHSGRCPLRPHAISGSEGAVPFPLVSRAGGGKRKKEARTGIRAQSCEQLMGKRSLRSEFDDKRLGNLPPWA